jgi:hypothetical protein
MNEKSYYRKKREKEDETRGKERKKIKELCYARK